MKITIPRAPAVTVMPLTEHDIDSLLNIEIDTKEYTCIANNVAFDYFDGNAIKRAYNQNELSRETVILLSPKDFLRLASPGVDLEKEATVKELIRSSTKFESLPHLVVETNKDGDVYVAGNGADHEGRHRVRELQKLGITLIPVILVSSPYGDGDSYRWGSTKKRPLTLSGYNHYTIKFPKIQTY